MTEPNDGHVTRFSFYKNNHGSRWSSWFKCQSWLFLTLTFKIEKNVLLFLFLWFFLNVKVRKSQLWHLNRLDYLESGSLEVGAFLGSQQYKGWNSGVFLITPKKKFTFQYIYSRYHSRFFVQVRHETTCASSGKKHFFTNSCHCRTYQNY